MSMRVLLASVSLLMLALSPAALAKQANTPMWRIAKAPLHLEVTVLPIEEKQQPDQITEV